MQIRTLSWAGREVNPLGFTYCDPFKLLHNLLHHLLSSLLNPTPKIIIKRGGNHNFTICKGTI